MADEKMMKQAQAVYETICKAFDNRGWTYNRNDEKLTVTTGVRGDVLSINLLFSVRPENQTVTLLSPLSFKMSEDKRVDGALAVVVANYGLINGSFDYDLSDGEIRFRMTQSYRDSLLSEAVFLYMADAGASTVDVYDERFMGLSNGMITLEQFLEWENSRKNG